jgi:hypothetical protein
MHNLTFTDISGCSHEHSDILSIAHLHKNGPRHNRKILQYAERTDKCLSSIRADVGQHRPQRLETPCTKAFRRMLVNMVNSSGGAQNFLYFPARSTIYALQTTT